MVAIGLTCPNRRCQANSAVSGLAWRTLLIIREGSTYYCARRNDQNVLWLHWSATQILPASVSEVKLWPGGSHTGSLDQSPVRGVTWLYPQLRSGHTKNRGPLMESTFLCSTPRIICKQAIVNWKPWALFLGLLQDNSPLSASMAWHCPGTSLIFNPSQPDKMISL